MNALSFVGVVFMVVGMVSIVAPNLSWSLQKWENSLRGQTSERSDAWEFGNVIRSVVLIVVGVLLVIAS